MLPEPLSVGAWTNSWGPASTCSSKPILSVVASKGHSCHRKYLCTHVLPRNMYSTVAISGRGFRAKATESRDLSSGGKAQAAGFSFRLGDEGSWRLRMVNNSADGFSDYSQWWLPESTRFRMCFSRAPTAVAQPPFTWCQSMRSCKTSTISRKTSKWILKRQVWTQLLDVNGFCQLVNILVFFINVWLKKTNLQKSLMVEWSQ